MNELVLTPESTVGDILSALPESESACIRDAVGQDAFDAMQNAPAFGDSPAAMAAADFPEECLSQESFVGLAIAGMFAGIGGPSPETRECINALAAEDPSLFMAGAQDEPLVSALPTTIRLMLCMNEEEAMAFGGGDPEQMQCVVDQLGGPDAIMNLFPNNEFDLSALAALTPAMEACGIGLDELMMLGGGL